MNAVRKCERHSLSTSGRVECNLHVIYHVERVLQYGAATEAPQSPDTIIFALLAGYPKMPTHLAVPGSNSTTISSNSTLVTTWNGDAGFSFSELDGMEPSEQVCAPLYPWRNWCLRANLWFLGRCSQ